MQQLMWQALAVLSAAREPPSDCAAPLALACSPCAGAEAERTPSPPDSALAFAYKGFVTLRVPLLVEDTPGL